MGKMSARLIYDWTIGRVVRIWKSGKWGKTLIFACVVMSVAIAAYFQIMESFRVEFLYDVNQAHIHALRDNDTKEASKYVLDIGSLKNLGAIRQLVGNERLDHMLKANRHYLDACDKYLLDGRNKRRQTGYFYRFHRTSTPSERVRLSKQLRDLGWGRVVHDTFAIEKLQFGAHSEAESVGSAEVFWVELKGRWKIIR